MLNKPLICGPVCFSQFPYLGNNTVNEHPYTLCHWAQLLLFLWDTVFEIMDQRNERFIELWTLDAYCQVAVQKCCTFCIPNNSLQDCLPLSWWLLSLRSIFLFFPFSFGVVLGFLIKALHSTDKLLLIPICHFLQGCWESIMLLC